MRYCFKARNGLFCIVPAQGRYELFFDSTCYGSYSSAVAAADDVYTKHTGCNEWDDSQEEGPTDVYEWEKQY